MPQHTAVSLRLTGTLLFLLVRLRLQLRYSLGKERTHPRKPEAFRHVLWQSRTVLRGCAPSGSCLASFHLCNLRNLWKMPVSLEPPLFSQKPSIAPNGYVLNCKRPAVFSSLTISFSTNLVIRMCLSCGGLAIFAGITLHTATFNQFCARIYRARARCLRQYPRKDEQFDWI